MQLVMNTRRFSVESVRFALIADGCGLSMRLGNREWFWNREMRHLTQETSKDGRRWRRDWTWDNDGLHPKPVEFWRKEGCTYLRIGRREWVWMQADSPRHPDTILRKIRAAVFRGVI